MQREIGCEILQGLKEMRLHREGMISLRTRFVPKRQFHLKPGLTIERE